MTHSTDSDVKDLHILSISLDGAIADRGSDAYQRQVEYASRVSSYTVVVKTDAGRGERIEHGSLSVFPTRSLSKYCFPTDAYRAAVRHVDRRNVDVITTQDPFSTGAVGVVLKRRFGAPLHVQSHVDFVDNPAWRGETPKNRLSELVGKVVLRQADAVRVGTKYERRKLRDHLRLDTPISVAPVRIDPDKVARASEAQKQRLRAELDIDDYPVVLFAGRFVEQKGLDTWVETARSIVDRTEVEPRFVLVGDGPDRQRIAERFRRAGLSEFVRFTGWVPAGDVTAFYELAEIFLITSNYEGTSRVIVEAGLQELPVVATPFAGAKDFVQDGETGYVASSPDVLAERVVSLLESPERRSSFGQAARAHLEERFDSGRLVEEYVSFLQPN